MRRIDADILGAAERYGAQLKRVTASEYAGPCPACGGVDRFSINVRKQIFNCRGFGGGDVIAMAMHALGVDFAGAIESLTGKETRPAVKELSTNGHSIREIAEIVGVSKSQVADDVQFRTDGQSASVAGIIAGLSPIAGTPGEAYLKEHRRIDTAAITDVLERTDAIGWHRAVYFNQDGHQLHGQRLGAIIGVMSDPITAEPTGAISRTYLDRDGCKIGKAKTLGAPAGIVRLSEDADVLGGLFLAEGLETALSAMANGLRPIWATGSTALMASFPLLNGIEALTIIADNDPSGAGEKAARSVGSRWRQDRRKVRIFRRDETGDLNDAIREGG